MTQQCLLRNIDAKFCEPTNALYIGLHGHDGEGGRIATAEVPVDYRGVLMADSPVRGAQGRIYDYLDKYVETFNRQFEDVRNALKLEGKSDNEIRIKSLYLWSEEPGTGKTTTASAILNEYLIRNFLGNLRRGKSPKQRPCYFLDVNELQTQYNQFNRPRVPSHIAEEAADKYYRAVEKAKSSELAVLDDIGVRDGTADGWRGDLHSIINHRTVNRMTTIYTSNVPIKELPEVFGEERLADRVRDMCLEVCFEGESKRGKRR